MQSVTSNLNYVSQGHFKVLCCVASCEPGQRDVELDKIRRLTAEDGQTGPSPPPLVLRIPHLLGSRGKLTLLMPEHFLFGFSERLVHIFPGTSQK